MSQQLEAIAQKVFDIMAAIEDLIAEITDGKGKPKSKVMEMYVGILQSISRLLDLSNAQTSKESELFDKMKERLGKAYGIYIKLLGISSANKDKNKDIENVNATLSGLSNNFKTVLTEFGEL